MFFCTMPNITYFFGDPNRGGYDLKLIDKNKHVHHGLQALGSRNDI